MAKSRNIFIVSSLMWLVSRPEKDARERVIEPMCDSGHLFVTELPECGRWLVVFKNAVSKVILVEHYADRSVQRRRESVSHHERGRNRVANVILQCVPRPVRDLQQRAMTAMGRDG
jgi:hypothetical protein